MGKQPQKKSSQTTRRAEEILKVATQIDGLDDILQGGFPEGRTTLLSGGPGTGKSILGLEFLYRGSVAGIPGIFLSFEETADSMRRNGLTFGWDLVPLEQAGTLYLMESRVEPHAMLSGDFNLKGLLAIIEGKGKEMGAARIVIDAVDMLTRFIEDAKRQQNEVLALNSWLKENGMTTLLTSKNIKDTDTSSRYDYLDFMADCVLSLDQRVKEQVTTKRLQVVKYRGSGFGPNEYPFLISGDGIHFNPISDVEMHYESGDERISSGSLALDGILGGGYMRGSCILITGTTGTGKTTLASTFARSVCKNQEKVLYVSYEESGEGMVQCMEQIGINLRPAIRDSRLQLLSVMPESMGIEEHLFRITSVLKQFSPKHLVVDAVSAVKRIAGDGAAFDLLVRLIDVCKKNGITVIFINQAKSSEDHELSGIGISSIIDTVIGLRLRDTGKELARNLLVLKSRGSKHSLRYHDFSLTEKGIQIDEGSMRKGVS
jgi:circadian clock protein KaiC